MILTIENGNYYFRFVKNIKWSYYLDYKTIKDKHSLINFYYFIIHGNVINHCNDQERLGAFCTKTPLDVSERAL